MPDFGLTEALAAALKASKSVEVMRPAETRLAAQAGKSAPAAPAVPEAAPPIASAPTAPAPSSVQAPPINPSQPPADMPAAAPEDASAAPTAAPAPPSVAPAAGDAAPAVPAAPEPPVAPPAASPTSDVAPANTLPPPPATPVQQDALRFVTANIGDFPPEKLNMSHMPNVDTMSSPDGVKAAILQIADDNKDAIEVARRGTVSDEQLTGLAQDLALNGDVLKQVMDREFGASLQRPEVVLAARMVEQQQMGTLLSLADKVASGSASSEEIARFVQQSQLVQQYRTQLSGVAAETGRSTRAFGIPVGLPPEVLDHIAQVLKQNNPDMQATAAAIKLAGTPSGIANIINGTSLAGRIGTATRSLLQRVFINGILSGPPTWLKIFVGNNFNLAVNQADLFTAGIGRGMYGLAARLGNFPSAAEGVQMSDAYAHMHGVISGGADALRVAGRVLKTGQSMDTVLRFNPAEVAGVKNVNPALGVTQSILPEIQNSYFGSIARGIDAGIDAPGSRVIGAVDDYTKTLGYRGYLTMMQLKEVRARMTAGTLRPGDAEQVMQDLMTNPSPEMEQAAEAWAHRMTFQTPFPEGGPGEAFSNFINSQVPALRFIFPFMRTATNIFKQSLVERTPLAAFSARLRSQIAAGGFEGDIAKARIATGTAIGGMLAWMAIHDRITGDAPKDAKERMEWELDGRTPYSIRITDPLSGKDTWRSYAWFEPTATVAGAVADAVKVGSYIHGDADVDTMMPHDQMWQDAIAHIMASVIQNTGNKTFMQGAAQFSEMYNDPQRAFGMWADQMGASMVPYSGMTKFIRNEQDPYMRQAFTLLDKIKDNLPTFAGVKGSETLPARLDVFGEPRMRNGGNSILGPLNPLPGSPSKKDDVTDAIQDVMERTRTVPITMPSKQLAMLGNGKGLQDGQGMRLTPREYNEYVRMSRADPVFNNSTVTFREKLAETIASPIYQQAMPAVRHDLLQYVQNQADKIGRERLFKEDTDFAERMTAWTAEKNRLKFNQ